MLGALEGASDGLDGCTVDVDVGIETVEVATGEELDSLDGGMIGLGEEEVPCVGTDEELVVYIVNCIALDHGFTSAIVGSHREQRKI